VNTHDIKTAVQMLHENKDTSGMGEDVLLVARVTLANGKFIKQSLLAGKTETEIHAEMARVGNTPLVIAPVIETVKLFMADETAQHVTNGSNSTTKPQHDPLPMLPASLKVLRQWVRWKLEDVNGRPTKIPYQDGGVKASSTDSSTWTDYETVCKAGPIDGTQGIGFVVDGEFVGVDLDGCRNPETEEISEWAEQIIDTLNSYTEITPSGMGVRVWVRGWLPGNDKVFNLDPACGYGSKVKIEAYTDSRYFTVTGDSFFVDPCEVEERDLTQAYKLFHDIKTKYPAPKSVKDSAADSVAETGDGTQIELLGTFQTSKYDIFTGGQIESRTPFIISNRIGRLRYESQSEADMAFCTVLAIHFDGDAKKIDTAMRESQLMRPKWERQDYREKTIAKAVASAQKLKVPTYDAVPAAAPRPDATAVVETAAVATATTSVASLEEKDIPAYNPAIECGFFKEVVDAVCNGTTIPRQFMHNVIKTFAGALASEHLKFDNLDCNSCQYSVNIGTSGTSKRTVWNRGILGTFGSLIVGQGEGGSIKIFDSVDSGAGLRDAFFDAPANAPILVVIDEAASLGNKANEAKNPEIVDTIIELADSTSISRVKAQKSLKRKAGKTHSNARLALYMCAQTGEVITQAFEGRKKQGIRERLSVEFSPPIEPGVMPPIPVQTKVQLVDKLVKRKR
jgi:putative DNA primase/helicase